MFEIIRISGIATGVGFIEKLNDGDYSESICETLFDTGNDKKDAAESERWATEICNSLNKSLAIEKQRDLAEKMYMLSLDKWNSIEQERDRYREALCKIEGVNVNGSLWDAIKTCKNISSKALTNSQNNKDNDTNL